MLLRFIPKGHRQWEVTRDNVTIAAITGSSRGLILTVEGAGLSFHEIEAVSNFMQAAGVEPETERVRRLS